MKNARARVNKNKNNKNKNRLVALRQLVNKLKITKKRRQNTLPAAITTNTPKRFNTIRTSGTATTVTGCDLIYGIPDNLEAANQNTQVIACLPANPSYWVGTRVAAVAAGYQNYRPIKFEVVYVPQCAVTQQGNVLGGSLWDIAPGENNLQQTLKTSNGGMLTQCYQTATATVRMKSNLQYNLYRMGGTIDQESNPFCYWALAIGCYNSNNMKVVPGYFYVRYTYVFKNPIGTGVKYQNSQLTTIANKTTYLLNASLYLCQAVRTANGLEVPVGARIDIEYNNNVEAPAYLYYYNGTLIDVGINTAVWILENQPYTITTSLKSVVREKVNIYYYDKKTVDSSGNVNVNPFEAVSFILDNKDLITWYNNTNQPEGYYMPQGTEYYTIKIPGVDLGTLVESALYRQVYNRPMRWTELVKLVIKKDSNQPEAKKQLVPEEQVSQP